MHPLPHLALAAAVGLALLLSSCGDGHDSESGEHAGSESDGDAGGEESGSESEGDAGGEHAGSESDGEAGGEESGILLAKSDIYNHTRAGARLILSYDADADAFVGTVENTTAETLSQTRIEVHLSSGVELGPTTPEDLPPGGVAEITLSADGEEFETWNAHPEVGRDEHG